VPGPALAQARAPWTVVPNASLAWWQVDPHMNHLWATTCPAEPSWRPGEGRSSGWGVAGPIDPDIDKWSGQSDTVHVPVYPRRTAWPVCAEAVHGRFVVPDTATGRGVRGQVTIRPDALVTGEARRDAWARDAVLQTGQYQEIRFVVDSLVDLSRQHDTLRGTAVGTLTLHGQEKPLVAAVKAYWDTEAAGFRVLTRSRVPARTLVEEFWPGCLVRRGCVFGLGVAMNIWKTLFFGADLLLRPTESGAE
jgi:hypothetical protein